MFVGCLTGPRLWHDSGASWGIEQCWTGFSALINVDTCELNPEPFVAAGILTARRWTAVAVHVQAGCVGPGPDCWEPGLGSEVCGIGSGASIRP